MSQFLSNKIIAGIVALALLIGVGVLISSGDTSTTTRNAALVVATPCTKPGQVTKVSKQSVVCATTNTGSLWYATMKAKGKAQACKSPGAIRKKSDIVWVCGVVKKKKLWQATRPLPPALDSTQVATPEAPVVADNTVLADTKIPDDKVVTQVIEDVAPTVAPTTPTVAPTAPTVAPTAPTVAPTAPTIPKTYTVRDIGPGGGIVFYVATMPFACGEDLTAKCTYLEAAIANRTTPSAWTPDTKAEWGCYGTGVMTSTQRTASLEIGTGQANTKLITAKNCKGSDNSVSAASIAAAYNGGDKTDWFLPSRKELDALCHEFFTGRTGTDHSVDNCMGSGNYNSVTGTTNGIAWSFAAFGYWSSSEVNAYYAWGQYFGYGSQKDYTTYNNAYYVRPVRAF